MAPFSGDSRSIARGGAARGCAVGVRPRKNAQERVRFALEARLDGPTPRAAGALEPGREQRRKLTPRRCGGNSTQQRTRHGRSSRSLLAAACRRSPSELELLLVHQLALLAEALYLRRQNKRPYALLRFGLERDAEPASRARGAVAECDGRRRAPERRGDTLHSGGGYEFSGGGASQNVGSRNQFPATSGEKTAAQASNQRSKAIAPPETQAWRAGQ